MSSLIEPPLEPIGGMVSIDRLLLRGNPFTRREADEHGISKDVLARLVREGAARRVLKGVYVDNARSDTLQLRAEALALVLPDFAVVCDRTAAWLHGADIVGPSGLHQVPPVDVLRLRGSTRIRRVECRGSTRTLDTATDIEVVNGVSVTTALRTALDLGRLLRRDQAIGALDALMRVGKFTVDDMRAELPRFRGHRWVIQLRELVPLADARADSPAESLTRLRLHDAGLPRPEVQWRICNAIGVLLHLLDLAYPGIKLAVEYDGEEFHTSDEDRAKDAARRAHLRKLGWTVVVLTRANVYGPSQDAAEIVRAAMRRLGCRV